MEVKSNGKVVDTFVDFADNMDFVLVSTKMGIRSLRLQIALLFVIQNEGTGAS